MSSDIHSWVTASVGTLVTILKLLLLDRSKLDWQSWSETEDGATLGKPLKLCKFHLADNHVRNLC
jgi:hypothetical protein